MVKNVARNLWLLATNAVHLDVNTASVSVRVLDRPDTFLNILTVSSECFSFWYPTLHPVFSCCAGVLRYTEGDVVEFS